MSLKIRNYLLTGPFDIDDTIVRPNQDPSVYAIVSKGGEPWNPTFKVLEVGDTGETGTKFPEHPNRLAWTQAADGKMGLYLLAFPRRDGHTAADRMAAAEAIRDVLKATGGVISIQGNV